MAGFSHCCGQRLLTEQLNPTEKKKTLRSKACKTGNHGTEQKGPETRRNRNKQENLKKQRSVSRLSLPLQVALDPSPTEPGAKPVTRTPQSGLWFKNADSREGWRERGGKGWPGPDGCTQR